MKNCKTENDKESLSAYSVLSSLNAIKNICKKFSEDCSECPLSFKETDNEELEIMWVCGIAADYPKDWEIVDKITLFK